MKMKKQSSFLFILVVLMSISVTSQELTLMTYNIKYANENDGENSWSRRKEFLTQQIAFYEPDIYGVQEAVQEQLEHLKSSIKAYDYVGEGRDGGNKGEYSAIFYKKNQFTVLESNTFWLAEKSGEPVKGWDAAYPRVCTYALFQDKKNDKKFWVFNTHFDHVGEKARSESSKLILQKIRKINKKGLPLFLMGDFNLEPTSKEIELISKNLNDSREIAKLQFGSNATFNGYNFEEAPKRRIDYIFSNQHIEVKKYGVLTDSKEQRYPSDHFPVFILAELR